MKKSPRFLYIALLITILLTTLAIPASARSVDITRSQQAVSSPTADAQVSVAHLAPFAASALGTSVTVRVNGVDAITNFEFGDIQNVSLPPDEYLIEILPTGSSTVAISGTFTLAADTSYTLVAIGDGVNQPLELTAFVKDTTPDASNAKLFVSHLAPFANTLPGTEVDICTDSGTPILTNFAFKEFTNPYLTLPPGDYDLMITLAGSICSSIALDIPSIRLAAGDIVDVFAIGLANGWPLSVTSTTGFNLTPAMVDVAHFAPFGATITDTSVTVQVDGVPALTDFVFGDLSGKLGLAPGNHLVEILPTGTSTVAISGTFMLDGGVDYTLAAIGDGTNQPLELFAAVKDTIPLTDSAKLYVAHLAPFANTLPGTEVDICTDDGTPILTNFAYKDSTDPYLTLTPGDYDLKITLAGSGCATVALDIPSIRLAAGDIVDVFAIGLANGWPLTVTSISGFNLTPPAVVNIAHLAPFAEATADTSVTVRVNGADVLTNFEYGEIADPVSLEPGDYLVEVLPTGTSTVAISGTFSLEAGVYYAVAAIGDGVNKPLELFPLVMDMTVDPDNAKLFLAHLAPFSTDTSVINSTGVDICTDNGTPILTDFLYKEITDPYLTLPAGDYNLKITVAGTNCATVVLDLPSIRLGAGQIVDVYAIGGANNWPLNVTTISGFDLTPARVSVGHFAPFASEAISTSVTVRVNGVDALTDFTFGELTGYIDFTPGDYLIEILPTGTSSVAISGTFSLDGAMDYTLSAIGDGSNQPLELFALVDDNSAPTAGNARLRIAHFAPFADNIDATRVDICTDGGTAVVSNVPYKGFTDPYLSLPAGLYDLKVTATGTSCGTLIFDLPPVILRDGMVASVFAIGGANGWAPTVVTVPDLLAKRLYMPLIHRTALP
jgi:hypothetical protein